jgi:hypothetical protein
MSELFSNERLIDYFTMFDLDITRLADNFDLNKLNEENENFPLKIEYKHNVKKMYPKKLYKGKMIYELNLESIFQMLTTEFVYLKKPMNKYFSLIFTNSKEIYSN